MVVAEAGRVSREAAEQVYGVFVHRLGVEEANKHHFVSKWLAAPDGRFGYSLGGTPYTFSAANDKWRVTTYLSGDDHQELVREVGAELDELRSASAWRRAWRRA